MLSEFLIKRSVESYNVTKGKFKKLSDVFKSTPNGYIEIKLKLFSWIPLVSSFFPNDLIKIYKQGDNLRIDCIYYYYNYIYIVTLTGIKKTGFTRGNMSALYVGDVEYIIFIYCNNYKIDQIFI